MITFFLRHLFLRPFFYRLFLYRMGSFALLLVAVPVTGFSLAEAPEYNVSPLGSPFQRFEATEAEPVACQASASDMLVKGLMMKGSVKDEYGWAALLSAEDGRLFKARPDQVIGPRVRVLSVDAGQTGLILQTRGVPGCPVVTHHILHLSRRGGRLIAPENPS
ncbi:hypothetical protein Q4491_05460 [Photobacterium sp. 2_MG-2023]|uniref:Uncharacterized protein n=1 Tax=Photobacterium arenosum TaxID=2774143 RepID=A0ABR9BM06_9GAMM|nr:MULTISPECIES: hypothetical protein [Photobacterium]MBD8513214.1 hypothetical protein [Photobacterium arenosum]MDO6580790.1 hypothetical protein [Photobacterium sp. 2_MG-2023]